MRPNIAFVGPAGIGKTTLAKILEKSMGYRRHALADPLKVSQAYITMMMLGLPILDQPFPAHLKSVERICIGRMGVWRYKEIERNKEAQQEDWLYNDDRKIRDFLVGFTNEHKVEMRGLLQQFGTEVVRGIGAKAYPEREKTEEETWIHITLTEARTDNRMGFPVCCDDVRYPHEADAFRRNGWEIVRVTRNDEFRGVGITDENINHSSEQMHRHITATAEYNNDLRLDLTSGSLEMLLSSLSPTLV